MKIQVSQLEANPYRRMEHYPIDPVKILALKNSIKETTFWDNILARPHPEKEGKYQIAYGHHRLQVIKDMGITEINIPVRKLDDILMIRIMANENMDDWKSNVRVANETVITAKEFIEEEITRAAGNYKQLSEEIQKLWGNEESFENHKRQGGKIATLPSIGRGIIKAFLGENWSEHAITDALAILNDPTIDREAAEEFKSPSHAKTFINAVKNINERAGSEVIPKKKQKALAQKIKKEIAENKDEKKKELTAEKIEHAVYQEFADTVKPPEKVVKTSKKNAMQKLLGSEEFKEWAAWLSILTKIKDRHPIANMSNKAKEEIKKLIGACSDALTEVNWEVE